MTDEAWNAPFVRSIGVLMVGSFIWLSHFSGAPPGANYEPAHMEDGRFVPGRVVR